MARGKTGLAPVLERYRFLPEILVWHTDGEELAICPAVELVAEAYERDHRGLDATFEALERMGEIKLFVGLPDWFTVPTPIGSHNPDWAILVERRDAHGDPGETLYLVRETKATTDPDQRRGTENMEIHCARRHFATLDVDYADVVNAEGLDL